jgi:hypothetical protein
MLKRAKQGTALTMHWMDNEASTAVKRLLTEQLVEYQLVPPHTHRRNAAERAICTFKNHFITGLCSANNDFLIPLWDQLLPQAKITINLMRALRASPTILAYEAVFGPFDHNWTLLAPPGCKVLLHKKPNQRKSRDPHGVKGWYLGLAMEQYRCYRCYVASTQAERVCEFSPRESTTPALSAPEAAIIAAEALTQLLSHLAVSTTKAHDIVMATSALQQLSTTYDTSKEAASPRVESSPRVEASPRVTPASKPIAAHTHLAVSAINLYKVGQTQSCTQPQGSAWNTSN